LADVFAGLKLAGQPVIYVYINNSLHKPTKVSTNNKIEGEITAIVLPFINTEGAVEGAQTTTGHFPGIMASYPM
jgi:hypothetical protein